MPAIVNVADLANLALLDRSPELQRKLACAVCVSSAEVPPDVITMQSRVVLVDGTGNRRVVSVVYPAEADAGAGRISVLDALGTALLGAALGDTLAPWDLRIHEILYQPERSMRAYMVIRRPE
jgi:regulator of nucleoside diphosphate kinase